jgi:hypothetical protein
MSEPSSTGDTRPSWVRAYLIGLLIAGYFIVATVWFPSWVLRWGPVAGAEPLLRDLIGSGVWFVALVFGLWALWRAQRARFI